MNFVPVRHSDSSAHRRLLAQAINQILKPEVTTIEDASMTNAWVNYDAVTKVRYWKDSAGCVHLSGIVKDGTLTSAAFTLPEGYRPAHASGLSTLIFANASNGAFGETVVASNGDVTPYVGSNVWFSLDGITFLSGGQ